MKKQLIPTLGRIIGKAVIVAAMACPIMFSSCEKYDDSELKESIADLNDRLTALEQKMNEQIAALTSLVNSKITVTEITTGKSGETIITLSDGKTITVYPETEMPDLSGLSFLTVKQEDGVYYWAVGGYGKEPEFLLIDGQKVPVVAEKDGVTLQGKIEGGKYYVSIDGGKTWVETGIEPKEDVKVFISYDQDADYVYLTLADGTIIKVAKDKELSFSILAESVYMTYGNTQMVELEMEGVVDYTITEKPDGWKAYVDGTYLVILAPEEGTGADEQGYIKILATFKNASPAIAKVYVHVEPDFVLKRNGDNITITLAEVNINNWNYMGYVTGAMLLEDFSAEAAAAYFASNQRIYPSYENLEAPISDIVGPDFDAEATYVIFASNYKDSYMGEKYTADDIKYQVCAPLRLDVQITAALDNANAKVTFSGYEGYYAGCSMKQYWSPEDEIYSFGQSWGPTLCTENYDGPAGLIGGGYLERLSVNTEYVLWVVPYDESGQYTTESFKIYEFSTLSLSEGGSFAAPSITLKGATLTEIYAEVEAVEGAYKTYASVFEADMLPTTDAEIVNSLLSGTSAASGKFEVKRTYLNPGTDVVIAAVAVGNDGKYGGLGIFATKTKALEFSETFKVSVESVKVGMTNASIKLAFEGGTPKSVRYINSNYTYGLNNVENLLAMNEYYAIQEVDCSTLTDNTLELTGLTIASQYKFYVIAFDTEGNMSHMAETSYEPQSDIVYVKKSKDNWSFGQPVVSNEVWGDDAWVWVDSSWGRTGWFPNSTTLGVDLTLPAECKKAYVLVDQPEYHTSKTEVAMSDWVVANGKEYTASATVSSEYVNDATHIYIVWIDSNDEYHTYYEYTPTFPAQPTEPGGSQE